MIITLTFALYLIIIFCIALIAGRRTHDQADFIFAHRNLGPVATALGAGASDMGGWLVMALPGAFFVSGLSEIWLPLIASCSTLTEDFYSVVTQKKLPEQLSLWFNRGALLVIALLALWLASNPETTLLNLVGYAWGGFGAAFGPVIIVSLYSERLDARAAMLGMSAGALVVAIWHMLGVHYAGIFSLYEIIPGFIANMLVMWLFMPSNNKP